MSRVSWLVLLCVLFAAGLSLSAQEATTSSSSSPISPSQANSSPFLTSQPQPALPQLSGQDQTPQMQSAPLLTPLPEQLPPNLTPEQAMQLLILFWPIIFDWSINSDKLPPLASLSLTFLSSSQQIAVGQSSSIASGQAAASSAEANAAGAGQSAQAAAGSAGAAKGESQTAATQATASANASGAAMIPLADAKKQADALGVEIGFLRVGCITLGVSTGALAVYELGRCQKWWK